MKAQKNHGSVYNYNHEDDDDDDTEAMSSSNLDLRSDSDSSRTKHVNPRCSRVISLIVGMSTLGLVGLAAFYFLDQENIKLVQKSGNENFQGTVSSTTLHEHATPNDCWVAIHGSVYDLTEYAPAHAGGAGRITERCGTDATTAYDGAHPMGLLHLVDYAMLGTFVEKEEQQSDLPEEEDDSEGGDSMTGGTNPSNGNSTTQQEVNSTSDKSVPTTEVPANVFEDNNDVVDDDLPLQDDDMAELYTVTVNNTVDSVEQPQVEVGISCSAQYYTLVDVADHFDVADCWFLLYDMIFNMTDYVDIHPGGSRKIYEECGTNATLTYIDQWGHDMELLGLEGMEKYMLGRLGTETGLVEYPC
jgi:cytochrome b involved in lipid metabolism